MDQKQNLEQAISNIFQSSVSASPQEELLRQASKYSMQINIDQIKGILFLKWLANTLGDPVFKMTIDDFVKEWLEMKQYDNTSAFILQLYRYNSLERYLNENSLKLNVQK